MGPLDEVEVFRLFPDRLEQDPLEVLQGGALLEIVDQAFPELRAAPLERVHRRRHGEQRIEQLLHPLPAVADFEGPDHPGVLLREVQHVLVGLAVPVVVRKEIRVAEHVGDHQHVLQIGVGAAQEGVRRRGVQDRQRQCDL